MPSWDEFIVGAPGRDATWTAFGFTLFSAVSFAGMTVLSKSSKAKRIGGLLTAVNAIGALSNLVMSLGATEMDVTFGREFQWVRWAAWAFTSPLLLAVFGLLVGVSLSELAGLTLCMWLTLAAGFAGAISFGTHAAWPLFTFGLVAFLYPIYTLLVTFTARATASNTPAVKGLYNKAGILSAICWAAYVIVWAVSNGGRHASPDQEAIMYSFFDIITCCVVGFLVQFNAAAVEGAAGLIAEPEATAAAAPAPATEAVKEVAV